MKKEVLILKYQGIFDEKVACRIIYQDDDILKRDEFWDKELQVYSILTPSYEDGELCIRGYDKTKDNKIFIVTKKEAEEIKYKVKKINEKYGKKCRWRAMVGEEYYYVSSSLDINSPLETNVSLDNIMYNNGNYFQTKEQAQEAAKRIKKVLNDYQNELKGE